MCPYGRSTTYKRAHVMCPYGRPTTYKRAHAMCPYGRSTTYKRAHAMCPYGRSTTFKRAHVMCPYGRSTTYKLLYARAGIPITVSPAPTSLFFVTTLPAPIFAPFPIFTGAIKITPTPIKASSSIFVQNLFFPS